jgi:hypothetical protein
MTKLALVWSAECAGREIDAIWEKRQAVERKRQDYDDTLRAKLIEAKANYDGSFKEFVEKHTHISLTTAKRTLRIADGRGEEVRQQERARQQRHRGVTTPVTPSIIPDLDLSPEAVEHRITEREANEATEDHAMTVEARRASVEFAMRQLAEVAPGEAQKLIEPLTPVTDGVPTIDKTFTTRTLQQVDALGLDAFLGDEEKLARWGGDIDLDLYDTIKRVARALDNIHEGMADQLAEPIRARWEAQRAADAAELEKQKQADEAARLARVKWEVGHADEARTRYRDEALAVAKEDRDYEDDKGDFDQAAFDAAYTPDADGRVHYGNPEHEFFERWCEEHHAIWPGHRDAPLPDREDARKRYERGQREQPSINLDGIDIAEGRKLLDTFPDSDDKDAVQKARLALAAFLKIKPPTPEPATDWKCDYAIDPIDGGRNERGAIHDEWEDANIEFSTAHRALEDKIWCINNPEEAAEEDRKRAKREAEKVKQLKADAKSPAKVKAKALKDAKRSAMESEMDEAKEDARENRERWGDLKDEWIEQWEADNWQPEQIAEAEAGFAERWEREHGKAFPASKYGKDKGREPLTDDLPMDRQPRHHSARRPRRADQ